MQFMFLMTFINCSCTEHCFSINRMLHHYSFNDLSITVIIPFSQCHFFLAPFVYFNLTWPRQDSASPEEAISNLVSSNPRFDTTAWWTTSKLSGSGSESNWHGNIFPIPLSEIKILSSLAALICTSRKVMQWRRSVRAISNAGADP